MSDFIPKQYKKEPITIRIDFGKLERIDKLASIYNLSRSEFINQCITMQLTIYPMSKNKMPRNNIFRHLVFLYGLSSVLIYNYRKTPLNTNI